MSLHARVIFGALILAYAGTGMLAQPADTIERIQALQGTLDAEYSHARLWYYGFTGLYVGSTVASFAVGATTNDPVLHITQHVAGWQSLLAATGMILSPMPSGMDTEKIRGMPMATPGDEEARLKAAETAVRVSAEAQEFNASWINHLAGVVVAGLGAGAIRYSYGRRIDEAGGGGRSVREAAINFWSSLLVGEIQIFTQPTLSQAHWDEYSKKYGVKGNSFSDLHPTILVSLVPGGLRAGIGMRF